MVPVQVRSNLDAVATGVNAFTLGFLALALVGGFASGVMFTDYMRWVRAKYPSGPFVHRAMRFAFASVPGLLLVFAARVVGRGSLLEEFFWVVIVGIFCGTAYRHFTDRRGKKPPA